MSKRTKWVVSLLLSTSMLFFASVALANTIYFPFFAQTTPPTPTITPTPTVTPTPQAAVLITHIEADPSGPDIESEYVTIRNQSSASVNMAGWALRDNANTTYTFPNNFTLGAGREVDVFSKEGDDTATELYWGLESAIWDNFKDCGYLYNREGRLVDDYCYTRTP